MQGIYQKLITDIEDREKIVESGARQRAGKSAFCELELCKVKQKVPCDHGTFAVIRNVF